MKAFKLLALALATTLSTTAAQAGVITVQFEGAISSSENVFSDPPSGPDEITSHPLGTLVSGSFTFNDALPDRDASLAVDNFSRSPRFFADPDFLDVSASISVEGGISTGSGVLGSSERAISRSQPRFGLFFADEPAGDRFSLTLSVVTNSSTGARLTVSLSLDDIDGNLFSSGDLTGKADQVLALLNDPSFPVGDIEGSFFSEQIPRFTGPGTSSEGTFEVTSISATSTASPMGVPTPTYASLFMLGLAGLSLLRRTRLTTMGA